jgi:hypothetical protein
MELDFNEFFSPSNRPWKKRLSKAVSIYVGREVPRLLATPTDRPLQNKVTSTLNRTSTVRWAPTSSMPQTSTNEDGTTKGFEQDYTTRKPHVGSCCDVVRFSKNRR